VAQYKVGDIVGSNASSPDMNWTVTESNDQYIVVRGPNNVEERHHRNFTLHNSDQGRLFLFEEKSTTRTRALGIDGPHKCSEHMEFCQGFRFDYYFCKVCGSKRNA
jgi:hypothetical protein